MRVGDAVQGPRSPRSRPCLQDLEGPRETMPSAKASEEAPERGALCWKQRSVCEGGLQVGPVLYFPGSAQLLKFKNHL